MKKIAFTLLSLLTIVGVGCNKVPSLTPESSDDLIVFTGDIAKGATNDALVQNAETKVGTTTKSKAEFIENDQIGVFVVPFKNDTTPGVLMQEGNYADNVPFIRDGAGKFAPSTANRITFPTTRTKVSLYAFAMYNTKYNKLGTNPKAQDWTVDVDQTVTDGSAIISNDLLTAQAASVAPGTIASLQFAHRMAMARVAFTTPDTYRGEKVISAKIKLSNIVVSATVDMTDNAVPPVTKGIVKSDVQAYQFASEANVLGGLDCVFEAVLVPQVISGGMVGVVVTLTTASSSVDFKCEAPVAGISYTSGNVTKVSLSFEGESAVTIQSVTITPWGDGGQADVDARRPAVMNFQVVNDDANLAKTVKYAAFVIDNEPYMANVELVNGILRCTYMLPTNKFGDKLQAVEFQDGQKLPVVHVDASPKINNLNIPGNPTAHDYAEIISKISFN